MGKSPLNGYHHLLWKKETEFKKNKQNIGSFQRVYSFFYLKVLQISRILVGLGSTEIKRKTLLGIEKDKRRSSELAFRVRDIVNKKSSGSGE